MFFLELKHDPCYPGLISAGDFIGWVGQIKAITGNFDHWCDLDVEWVMLFSSHLQLTCLVNAIKYVHSNTLPFEYVNEEPSLKF